MAMVKSPTGEQSNKIFEPYAIALGELVYSWNHLHEELANMFWRVTGIKNGAIPFAIWHSTPSDLAQRKMLRAATKVAYSDNPEAEKEIIWLLDQVDHTLSSRRNNAIHAPLVLFTGLSGTTVEPYEWTNNPKADALFGKDILPELIWYRQTVDVLRDYSWALKHALHPTRPQPLPKRPTLPHFQPPKDQKGKPPGGPRAGRSRPHVPIHEI